MKYITLIIGLLVAAGCSKSLTEEEKKVVGSYEAKKDGDTYKHVYLENGKVEYHWNGKKMKEGKWKISEEGKIHFKYDNGDIDVYRINKDGSINHIARIDKDGKRIDMPKDLQATFKRIK